MSSKGKRRWARFGDKASWPQMLGCPALWTMLLDGFMPGGLFIPPSRAGEGVALSCVVLWASWPAGLWAGMRGAVQGPGPLGTTWALPGPRCLQGLINSPGFARRVHRCGRGGGHGKLGDLK